MPPCEFSGGIDGGSVQATLVQGSDDNYYGVTPVGAAGFGTVFQLTPDGVLTTIYAFTNGVHGGVLVSSLVPGPDGRLYGTTSMGGTNGWGTIFALIPPVTPLLISQPISNESGSPGGSAIFNASISGLEPFTYQWRFNGTNITGATNSTLILSNLLATKAGAYSFVAGNAAGSVSSAPAKLSYLGLSLASA